MHFLDRFYLSHQLPILLGLSWFLTFGAFLSQAAVSSVTDPQQWFTLASIGLSSNAPPNEIIEAVIRHAAGSALKGENENTEGFDKEINRFLRIEGNRKAWAFWYGAVMLRMAILEAAKEAGLPKSDGVQAASRASQGAMHLLLVLANYYIEEPTAQANDAKTFLSTAGSEEVWKAIIQWDRREGDPLVSRKNFASAETKAKEVFYPQYLEMLQLLSKPRKKELSSAVASAKPSQVEPKTTPTNTPSTVTSAESHLSSRDVLNEGSMLKKEGKFAEALDLYRRAYREITKSKLDKRVKLFHTTRVLDEWSKLRLQYWPASQALSDLGVELWNNLTTNSIPRREDFLDAKQIFYFMDTPAYTYGLFKVLDQKHPDFAAEHFLYAQSAVLAENDFELSRKYLKDAEAELKRAITNWDISRESEVTHFIRRLVHEGSGEKARALQQSVLAVADGKKYLANSEVYAVARICIEEALRISQTNAAVSRYLDRAITLYIGAGGQPIDEKSAHALLERAYPNALVNMWRARCYAQGRLGYIMDKSRGEVLARESIQEVRRFAFRGTNEARFLMGSALLEGLGGRTNIQEGMKWLRQAADEGHATAQLNLGTYLQINASGDVSQSQEGLEWLRRAADSGTARARYQLGMAYFNGSGVNADRAEALKLFLAAGGQNHPRAMVMLGRMYESGIATPKQLTLALEWRKRAALLSDPEAMYAYGMMLRSGIGTQVDVSRGEKWMADAIKAGYRRTDVDK